jgi:hypothetical protein
MKHTYTLLRILVESGTLGENIGFPPLTSAAHSYCAICEHVYGFPAVTVFILMFYLNGQLMQLNDISCGTNPDQNSTVIVFEKEIPYFIITSDEKEDKTHQGCAFSLDMIINKYVVCFKKN